MKANELSNEQLIDDLIDGHILGHPLYNLQVFRSTSVLRKELLCRLTSGDKAKNAMDKIFNALTENNSGGTFCEVRKIRQDKISDISNKYRKCIIHR